MRKPKKIPEVIFSGNISEKKLSSMVSNNFFAHNPVRQLKIDVLWDSKKKEAIEKDLNFYNGTSYCLENIYFSNEVLHCEFQI